MNKYASIRETSAQHSADITPEPVLEVMENCANALALDEMFLTAKSLREARAAVAEMIEVQEASIADLEYAVAIVGQHNEARAKAISLRLQRHRDALARCDGGRHAG